MTVHAPECAPTALIGRGGDAVHPQLPDGTLGYLAGDWDVAREIADHRTGIAGSFRGRASFRPPRGSAAAVPDSAGSDATEPDSAVPDATEPDSAVPDGLDGRALELSEQGELRFGGRHGPASRSLLYYGCSDGSADVRFVDGREFYRLDLRTGGCRAVHPCRADRYAVTVTWLSADSFTEVWQVTGPDKDYDLTSVYTRTGCAS